MSSSVTSQSVDVLIIGAGPAGVMAALALLQSGVKNIKIIDIAAKKTTGYAGGVVPRTVEGVYLSTAIRN